MHEFAICQSILQQVKAVACAHGAKRVSGIDVQIGPLSGIEPPLLQRAFSIARCGTVAERAELRVTSLPVQVSCKACGAKTEAMPARLNCAACGDAHTRLASGDEMLLASIELEVDTEDSS